MKKYRTGGKKYQGGGQLPAMMTISSGGSKKEKRQLKKDQKRRIKSSVDSEGNPYKTLKVKDKVKKSVKDSRKRRRADKKTARKNKTAVSGMIMTKDGPQYPPMKQRGGKVKKYKPKTGRAITKKAAERKEAKGKGYKEMSFPSSPNEKGSFRQYSGKAKRAQKKRVKNLSKNASVMDKVDAYKMNMSGSKSRPIKQRGGRTLDQRLADKKKKQDARNTAKVSRAKADADVKNIRSSAKNVASRNKGYRSRADEVKSVARTAASTRSQVKGTAKTKNKNFTGDRRLIGDNVSRTSNNRKTSIKTSSKRTTNVDNSRRSKSNVNQSSSTSRNAPKTRISSVKKNQSKTQKGGVNNKMSRGGRVIKGSSLRFTRKR